MDVKPKISEKNASFSLNNQFTGYFGDQTLILWVEHLNLHCPILVAISIAIFKSFGGSFVSFNEQKLQVSALITNLQDIFEFVK